MKESTTKSSMLRIQDHISGVRRRVTLVCTALMNRAITHDNSKYSEKELNAHISMADEMDGIKYGTDVYYAIKRNMNPYLPNTLPTTATTPNTTPTALMT